MISYRLLLIFITLNILNVILQTVKSIATVKCGKVAAALVNAVAFGLYTVVTVYTMCDLPLSLKAGIVALCNLVGVYVVKLFEEKARKDKLWKVEATVPSYRSSQFSITLDNHRIEYNCIKNVGQNTIFNIYCPTQAVSEKVRNILNHEGVKHYFVSETKTL